MNTHLLNITLCDQNLPVFGDVGRMNVPRTKTADSAFEKGVIQRIVSVHVFSKVGPLPCLDVPKIDCPEIPKKSNTVS